MSRVPETLTAKEAYKLLKCLETMQSGEFNRWRNLRNYTMAVIMLNAGLRIGEVVKLKIEHLMFNGEPVKSLNLDGVVAEKGCVRIIPCHIRIQQAVAACWCNFWSEFQNPPCSWAFFDQDIKQHLSVRQVQRIIRKAAKLSIGRGIHPHVLRHTFATNLMRITDIRVVQELLGHKHITSTQVYTHPNGDDKQKAIDLLSENSI